MKIPISCQVPKITRFPLSYSLPSRYISQECPFCPTQIAKIKFESKNQGGHQAAFFIPQNNICHPERARSLCERRTWARRANILAVLARMRNREKSRSLSRNRSEAREACHTKAAKRQKNAATAQAVGKCGKKGQPRRGESKLWRSRNGSRVWHDNWSLHAPTANHVPPLQSQMYRSSYST